MKSKSLNFIKGFIFLIFLYINGNISATNYYVSMSDGKDSNNGTSASTPWKTLAHVDNGTTFKAGDSILFKCGDRWSVKTNRHYATNSVFTYSGTVNNRIVLSSYGTGLKPKIYGAIPVLGFTAHPTISNVYKCDSVIENDLNNIQGSGGATGSALACVDGNIIWMDGALQRKTSFAGLTNNWDWYWENKSLYFYYDGNINDIDTIEVMQSAWGITLSGSYVSIDGLSLRYWASRCIGNYPEKTRYGIEIRNCEISYTAFKRSGVGYGISMASSDMIIENNEIHHNGRRNISLNVYTDGVIMRNVIIQNNSLHSGYHTTGVDIHQASPSATGYITKLYIRNNHIWEDSETYGYTDSEVLFLQNGDQASADETHLDSIYFYNNLVTDIEMDGIYMQGTGPTVYYCYNTLTGSSSYRRGFIFSGGTYNEKHIVLMNNIFLNTESHMASVNGPSDKSLKLDTMDYNIHFTPNNLATSLLLDDVFATDYYYNDIATIRSLGVGVHSFFTSRPCFVDSLSNWNLKASSPAIKNGFPMPWLTTTDYYGNPRDPLHPTIGAIEFDPDPSANNIISFILDEQTKPANIDLVNHTITIEVINKTDITKLTPTIVVSVGAKISPASGVTLDFSDTQVYVVTALNGDQMIWKVNVTMSSSTNKLPIAKVSFEKPIYKGIEYFISASNSYDPDSEKIDYTWGIPSEFYYSNSNESVISILPALKSEDGSYNLDLNLSDNTDTVQFNYILNTETYRPETAELSILNIEASDYDASNMPENIIDTNINTKWTSNGDNQFILFELEKEANLSHIELSVGEGESRNASFELFASTDKEDWDIIIDKQNSCGYTSDFQIFTIPEERSVKTYKYLKLIAHMNNDNDQNAFNEFKIYGDFNVDYTSAEVNIYPNPSDQIIYVISTEEKVLKILNTSGQVVFATVIKKGYNQIIHNLESGMYIVSIEFTNYSYNEKLVVNKL